jgi:glycosyltransferase involved in cell wall biosynthesis
MYRSFRVTAVIPALDEQAVIGTVVRDLRALRGDHGGPLLDEVIVCDNGSTDRTAVEAVLAGARVVSEPRRGYGSACLAALAVAKETDAILFVDGDGSVVASQAVHLLEALVDGAALVIGSRTLGWVEAGAMTWPQRIGNRLVASLIGLIWQSRVTDLGPFRAIRASALDSLNMEDRAYGWTVEMQVKALQRGLPIREVPVDCRVRVGKSKVSGTLRGVFGAALGMLGMVARLWWWECRREAKADPASAGGCEP